MQKSPRLTLAQTLMASSAVMIATMVGLAIAVWVLLTHEAESAKNVGDNRVPQLQRIADIELNVTRASLQVRQERNTASFRRRWLIQRELAGPKSRDLELVWLARMGYRPMQFVGKPLRSDLGKIHL